MLKNICRKIDNYKNPRLILGVFLLIWFLVNLLQACFTELAHDESYYWMYSRWLDWGYFDHPPMIALLIKLGYSVFENELGVRLFPLLMGTSTIFIVYLLLKDEIKSISLFIILVSSIIIFKSHIGGFLAIPDIPVVFFAALFLLIYKKYIETDSVKLAILLAIVAAAMLYSKYHGILVLLFTFFSNLKIAKRWSFYIIPVLTAILFLPHIFWQFKNNFPTLEYHLVGRSSLYKFDHTFNYLYSQLLIAGPFISVIVFYHAWRLKTNSNLYYRALKYNFYGFIVFFFLSSFKGHVEAHWTAIAYIPAVILAYISILNSNKAIKWLRNLFIPTIILMLFIRICLIFEILPNNWNIGKEFHNWDKWAQQVKEKADGRKVVFANSFQRPSKYAFYTHGEFAHTLNSLFYRKNQYDLWHFADSIQGKKVFFTSAEEADDTLSTAVGEFPYNCFDEFHSYYDLKIEPLLDKSITTNDTILEVNLKIYSPNSDTVIIKQAEGESPAYITATYFKNGICDTLNSISSISDTLLPNRYLIKKTWLPVPKIPGKYLIYFSITSNRIYPPFNSQSTTLIVE